MSEENQVEENQVEENLVEEKAKRMGWVPQENFKGDAEKWIDAEAFVSRGENELPILRERLKKMDGDVVSMKKALKEFKAYHDDVAQREYDKALSFLQEEQRKAAKNGDLATYDKVEQEKQKLVKPAKKVDASLEFERWISDGNQWFKDDREMGQYASSISSFVQAQTGFDDGFELYDAVKKEVQKRFPDRFENKNKNRASAVIPEGDPTPKAKKQSFEALPKDAKEQCLRFIKEIPGFTKEQYIKNYDWE